MIHMLDDPWAEHPVVNRHICYGEGGGSDVPQVPDYSQYIESMTKVGNELTGYGRELFDWAKQQGVKISGIADVVGERAGKYADQAGQQYTDMMAKWKKTYEPLYDAQAADAQRMIGELPRTEEQYAGKYGADVGQAFDASAQAQERELQRYGLKAPGSGAHALNAMVKNQRGLAQVAGAEQGRLAARTEARDVAGKAIQSGLAFPQVGQQGAANMASFGNQQMGAPASAIASTVGAYAPGTAAFNSGLPWMKSWGDTMSNSYNQSLAANKADEGGGGGMGGMLGGLAGTVAGSFMGPMGASIGGTLGGKVGSMIAEEGGAIQPDRQAGGDEMVTPDMSGSQGAITDDVPARLNVGEFVLPKRFVEWKGEEWIQKEIAKADKARETQTVAEPEMAELSAFDAQAPQFQSQGASV